MSFRNRTACQFNQPCFCTSVYFSTGIVRINTALIFYYCIYTSVYILLHYDGTVS